ncbi:TPA: hypothetical protein ACQTWV_000394 [Enterobacter roggenkampii]
MNKLEFSDLPESVQIIAAEILKQQMNCCGQSEWPGEAKRIAKAFLALYEGTDTDIKLEVMSLSRKSNLMHGGNISIDSLRQKSTAINGEMTW